MTEKSRLELLHHEIRTMLAAALTSEERHAAELDRRDVQHVAEIARRDELHVQEMRRRDDLHASELALIRQALETRDLVGQAKGVIMAALSCSPDEAFELLRKQSQLENVRLVDVAAEIARRASSLGHESYERPSTG